MLIKPLCIHIALTSKNLLVHGRCWFSILCWHNFTRKCSDDSLYMYESSAGRAWVVGTSIHDVNRCANRILPTWLFETTNVDFPGRGRSSPSFALLLYFLTLCVSILTHLFVSSCSSSSAVWLWRWGWARLTHHAVMALACPGTHH